MKLNVVKAKVPAAVQSTARGNNQNVITKKAVDRYSFYNGSRIPVSTLTRKIVGTPIPSKLREHGFLLVTSKDGGILVREVKHDGAGFYQRMDDETYGSTEAVNGFSKKGVHAEVISRDELVARAAKFNRPMSVKHKGAALTQPVCLLNDFGDQYVAGVTVSHGKLTPLNMEHPASYNTKDVQYTDPQTVKLNVRQFLAAGK